MASVVTGQIASKSQFVTENERLESKHGSDIPDFN